MLQLKLTLVKRYPTATISTGARAFDEKSYEALDIAINSGIFGRCSKSVYWLTGSYHDADGEWKFVEFPLYGPKLVGRKDKRPLNNWFYFLLKNTHS